MGGQEQEPSGLGEARVAQAEQMAWDEQVWQPRPHFLHTPFQSKKDFWHTHWLRVELSTLFRFGTHFVQIVMPPVVS